MSFNIFASGNPNFEYSRRRCADGDVFEATAVMSALQAASPSFVGAAEAVGDYVLPSVAGDVRDSAQAHGGTIWRQRLGEGLRMLASNPSAAHGGFVSVSAIQYIVGIRHASRSRTFYFRPGNNDPISDFMYMILPVLTHTDMNNYGVLREMANAVWAYRIEIGSGGPPMLTIQLDT
jgi:hypothetical protein